MVSRRGLWLFEWNTRIKFSYRTQRRMSRLRQTHRHYVGGIPSVWKTRKQLLHGQERLSLLLAQVRTRVVLQPHSTSWYVRIWLGAS